MNPDHPDLDRLIDLLVDDEFDPGARRALFDRLDAEPGGWRRCACAFLEAQSWRAALAPVAAGATSELGGTNPLRRRPSLVLAGVAAGLFAAFALGWAAHDGTAMKGAVIAATPVAQHHDPEYIDLVNSSSHESKATVPAAITISARQAARPLPEALRRLQQGGYEIEPPRHRVIALELKNGPRVALPVGEIRVRYVGKQTF